MSQGNTENGQSKKKNFYVTRKVAPAQTVTYDSRPISPINHEDLNLVNTQDRPSTRGKQLEEVGLIQDKSKEDLEPILLQNKEEVKKTKEEMTIQQRKNIFQNNFLTTQMTEKEKKSAIDPQQIKKQRFRYSLAFIIVILSFSLTNEGLSIVFFIKALNDTDYHFDSMKQTIQTGAYCDIDKSVITSVFVCSSGSTRLPLGKFEGTKVGCHCPGATVVTEGACKSSSECTTVGAAKEQSITLFNGLEICGTTTSFKFSKICNSTEGYTKCGSNICVLGSTCPISYLEYVSGDPAAPLPSADYSRITINGGSLLYVPGDIYSNNVLMEFSYSHGFPCLAWNKHWFRANYNKEYPLENTERQGCGKYGNDYQFMYLDSDDEEDVLNDNNIDFPTLPLAIEYIQNQRVILFARFGPKLNGQANVNSCTDNLDFVCTALEKAESHRKPSKYGGYACFAAYSISACGIVVQFIVFLVKRKNFHKGLLLRKIFIYYSILLSVGSTVLFGLMYGYIPKQDYRVKVETIAEEKCYDSETMNSAFNDFNDFISNLLFRNLLITIIFSLSLAQSLITSILSSLMVDLDRRVMNLESKIM